MLLCLTLTGCPTLSLVSPSFTYNNNYNAENNPNEIECSNGNWYTSAYCAIPIPKFIALSSNYADPNDAISPLTYGLNHQTFFFDDINKKSTLDELNQIFLKNYPNTNTFANLPLAVQKLYITIKEDYIPKHNYQKLMEAYTLLYTISTLHFATAKCKVNSDADVKLLLNHTPQMQQKFVLYKAFSLQFSNAVLLHISNSFDTTYADEATLYNALYATILDLNPYQLNNLAQSIFNQTLAYMPKNTESTYFYKDDGIHFGELGSFSCNKNSSSWYRFGFEFFGTNTAGVLRSVKIKNIDSYKKFDKTLIPINESNISNKQ